MSQRMLKRVFPVAVATAALIGSVHADNVDDIMKSLTRSAPGAVLLVVKDGKTVRYGGYGFSSLETMTPVRRDSVFEIGSVSKQFTACGVLMLSEEGKLTLDDPVGKHLPEAPEKWRALTLRQLLSHTSGLKDTMQALDDPKFRARDYEKKMGSLPFDFEPGTSWSYSNMGYNLAAEVIEKVSGERMADFLKKRVFDPLKMTHTRYTNPEAVVKNRACGYAGTPGKVLNISASYPETALGAGTLMSTVDDMAKWDQAILTGKILSDKSRKEWVTPIRVGDTEYPYGLGWFVTQDRGRPLWEHGGNTMGFSCSNFLIPEEKASIIVLSNMAGIGMSTITRRIGAELFPSYNLAKRTHEPDAHPERVVQLAMTLRAFGRGQYQNLDVFAPNMKGTLSSIRGALTRMGLGSAGKLLVTYRHIDSENLSDGRTLSRYDLVLKDNVHAFTQVTWSKEGKVEGFATLYGESHGGGKKK